jgi:Zn-dependent protease with chaperone function
LPARTDPAALSRRPAAWRPYALQAGLAAVGLTTAAVAVVGAVGAVRIDPGAAHVVRVAGQALSYPAVNVAAVVLLTIALMGAISVARMVRLGRHVRRAHRRLNARLSAADAGALSIDVAGEAVEVRRFVSDRPEAFCAGFLRPRIWVSTAAIEALDPPALAAVAAHERHHQRAHDPLRTLTARLLARGLFFLPVLGRLLRSGELLAELDADAEALRAWGQEVAPLASAMVSMGASPDRTPSGIDPERVDHLLGSPVRTPLPMALIGAGLLTLTVMTAVVWGALRAATISATFSLPLVSRQPCVLVLALVPGLVGLCATAVSGRGHDN